MASRLHQRSARDALFSNYDAQQTSRSRPASAQASPARPSSRNTAAPYSTFHGNNSSPYAFAPSQPSDLSAQPPANGGFSAYPGHNSLDVSSGRRSGDGGFRSATPDKKGRYADAVYNELESQNDEQVGAMTEKVKMLKSVSLPHEFPSFGDSVLITFVHV
ncbi:protein transport protein bet1 [Vermiconidia calcicola]|uniref:Protein transport protein bet1 n=1 Tax=Vermiconidia calcicola TaxID=1690605 RepID=A0ACC3MHD7_9PEZI|nr:protein transport protein bet1 [Vermiconidia calcicola]